MPLHADNGDIDVSSPMLCARDLDGSGSDGNTTDRQVHLLGAHALEPVQDEPVEQGAQDLLVPFPCARIDAHPLGPLLVDATRSAPADVEFLRQHRQRRPLVVLEEQHPLLHGS